MSRFCSTWTPGELDLATDPPPLSAASRRLLVTCWPATGDATMSVLGH